MPSPIPRSTGPASSSRRLFALVAVLFLSYLCVALPLPVIPLHVKAQLGFGNSWAGFASGIAFLSTILTRGHAGQVSDRLGAKTACVRGLCFYAAGSFISLLSCITGIGSGLAFAILVAGRLFVGYGESLVGVGVVSWGIGIAGPERSGRVIATVGAAIYGALAIGGPLGFLLFHQWGFAGNMAASLGLSCAGLATTLALDGVPALPTGARASFLTVFRQVWTSGTVVFLQGVGFAGIGSFFALYLLDRDWPNAGFGLAAFGAGFVAVRILGGHLPDRIGGFRVAALSMLIEAMGQFVIWSARDPDIALGGAFLTGLGCSLVYPSMGREVVRLVQPALRGTAVGIFGAFQDLAYGLTGPVAGLLADRAGYGSVFLVGGIAASLGFLTSLSLYGQSRLRQPNG